MISRIKKLWDNICDILEGPGEYSAPDDRPLRWVLVKGRKWSHIGYTKRQESIYREPGFSDSLDLF